MRRAFEAIGAEVLVSKNPDDINNAKYIVLPGVGAYSTAMKLLNELNFLEPLEKANKRKASLMGICLGMQLFFDESEEFKITKGLGFIPGKIKALKKVIQSNINTKEVRTESLSTALRQQVL